MATTHSSILTWKIPQTEETGRLPFTGSQRTGCDWVIGMYACITKTGGGWIAQGPDYIDPLFYSLLWSFWHSDLDSLLVSPFLKNGFILLEWNYEKKTPTSSSCLVFCRICLFKEMTFRRCSWEIPNFSGLSSADSSDCCGKQTEEPKDLISSP